MALGLPLLLGLPLTGLASVFPCVQGLYTRQVNPSGAPLPAAARPMPRLLRPSVGSRFNIPGAWLTAAPCFSVSVCLQASRLCVKRCRRRQASPAGSRS